MCGGVYYGVSGGEWVLNSSYGNKNSLLRQIKACEIETNFINKEALIYNLAVEGDSLLFLNKPEILSKNLEIGGHF